MMLTWREAAEAGSAICGGKGYNLARLARYGFRVPPGGVLPAECYRETMDAPDRRSAIEHGQPTDLPGSVRRALRAFVEASGLATLPVAVRSSATAEDSARASFAGIHRSVLNVRGLDAIERAVTDCYASLWTPQARAYRARMGFADDEVACAVVVCRMVTAAGASEPRAAGVAFSADPRTGRRDRIVIDAVAGSGEGAVSGRANPQRFAFDAVHAPLALRESADGPLLTSQQLYELAGTVHRIHWALGEGQDPQDVEWAHDGELLWILQARPITALPKAGPEAFRRLPQYWSRGNIKDSVPGVPCELTWSALPEIVHAVAFAALPAAGYPLPTGQELVRRFRGRGYFEFTLLQWAFFDAFGVLPEVSVRTVGGHQPTIPVPPGDPLKGPEGRRRQWASLRLLWALVGFEGKHTALLRRHIAEMREIAAMPLEGKSTGDLKALLASLDEKQRRLAPVAGLANSAYGRWFVPLEAMLTRLFGARGPALAAALSAGSGDITSAEQGYRVQELARLAREEPAVLAWLDPTRAAQPWTDLPPSSAFRRAFQFFLDDFGHRATIETDARLPRWVEDPSPIIQMIRDQIATTPGPDPRRRARDRYRAAETEIRATRMAALPLVRWMARGLRRAYAVRELGKSALVAGMLPVRRVVLEIGRRLTDRGQLEMPTQAFDLSVADLRAWLEGFWDGRGARDLALDRSRRREEWLRDEPADVIAESADVPAPAVALETSGDGWHGIAVSSGRIVGIARVVRRPEDGGRLAEGEVLVAPSTDPGWTPLFLRASAVVMEIGGYLSHGAIVAREYGLPAVVNIPNLLQLVKDGDTLMVDGDAGTVAIVDRGKDGNRTAGKGGL